MAKGKTKTTAKEIIMGSRKEIAEEIISKMDQGISLQEWLSSRPSNAVNGTKYKGINSFRLSFAASKNGYKDPRWATFIQGKGKGWKLKDGSKGKGVLCEKWLFQEKEKKDKDGNPVIKDGTVEKEEYVVSSYFTVFNAECFEGIPPLDAGVKAVGGQWLYDESPVKIERGDKPCYDAAKDVIKMPEHFTTNDARYSEFFRHLVKATAYNGRMPRDTSGWLEELVDELGAAFLCADTSVKMSTAAAGSRLASWSMHLKEDPNVLFKAVRLADYAVGWISDVTGLEEAGC